jgi:type II secretory pathway pseudopilin PulG
MKTHFHARGATLIELIAFIIIVGVLVSGLAAGLSGTLRGSTASRPVTQALQLAQERMELIRGQKEVLGFSGFTAATYDPCALGSAHPACNTTFGYTVTPDPLDEAGLCMGGDINYKCITVTVTDASGATLSRLQAAVANY